MTLFFADTSAIAKRYLATESGHAWLKQIASESSGNIFVRSELTTVEMLSILARRQREHSLTADIALEIEDVFLGHARTSYLMLMLDRPILVQAGELVRTYPLRTLDAIQLSCAVYARELLSEPIIFLSSDRNLLGIARSVGFVSAIPIYIHSPRAQVKYGNPLQNR